jgi:hypothetical protein
MQLGDLESIQVVVTGTREQVAERLTGYVGAGVRHLVVRLAALDLASQGDQLEQVSTLLSRSWPRNRPAAGKVAREVSSHPVTDLLARVPEGWSAVRYRGRRWGVSHTRQAGGQIEKLYAEELGGTGVISANLYVPDGTEGEHFRPCEMPAADVLDFLRGWEPVPESARP